MSDKLNIPNNYRILLRDVEVPQQLAEATTCLVDAAGRETKVSKQLDFTALNDKRMLDVQKYQKMAADTFCEFPWPSFFSGEIDQARLAIIGTFVARVDMAVKVS